MTKPKTKARDRRVEQITLRASEAERQRLAGLAQRLNREAAEVIRAGVNLLAKKEGCSDVFR